MRRGRGAEAHAIGRCRGGLTTKIHAAVDALGLPVRFSITPGERGDRPQARRPIEGLTGVCHGLAEAACDAGHLRQSTADEMGATARIKQNPSRSGSKASDRAPYAERHLVEVFCNRIERVNRIALRCEKAASSFRAFVALACAMTCLARMKTPPARRERAALPCRCRTCVRSRPAKAGQIASAPACLKPSRAATPLVQGIGPLRAREACRHRSRRLRPPSADKAQPCFSTPA